MSSSSARNGTYYSPLDSSASTMASMSGSLSSAGVRRDDAEGIILRVGKVNLGISPRSFIRENSLLLSTVRSILSVKINQEYFRTNKLKTLYTLSFPDKNCNNA